MDHPIWKTTRKECFVVDATIIGQFTALFQKGMQLFLKQRTSALVSELQHQLTDKSERKTKVFAKAGLDNVSSALCKYQQQFQLDVQCSTLVLNFNNIFLNGL